MKTKNKVEFHEPDRYFKTVIYDPSDDFFVGTIKYLLDQGKTCKFLGFNIWNAHVVLIDGVKYYVSGEAEWVPPTMQSFLLLMI
jgi:hypothetical protein